MTERRDRLSRAGNWSLTAAATLVIIVLLFLTAEGAIRVRQTIKYGAAATVEDLYTMDARSGLRVPVVGSHYSGRITVNSLGFRGPELATPKSPGTVRLAFLGASTTWCGEVSGDDKTWPHLVTAALRAAFPYVELDYLNAAVPGYTVRASLRNLEVRVAALEPDVVIIYEGANDLSGEMRELALKQGLIRDAKISERSWLARHSLLWNLVEKNLDVLSAQDDARSNIGRLQVDPAAIGLRFRQDLTSLVEAAKEKAKVVAVVTFSIQPRADQDKEQQLRASASALYYMPFIAPETLIAAYARYNEVIRQVAKETGVLLIDEVDSIPGDALHFADTVHFTDSGSELMARRVVRALQAQQILARDQPGRGH